MEVFRAAMGVGGGLPPANVDMVYCCASATEPLASRQKTIRSMAFAGLRKYTLLFRDVPIVEKVAATLVQTIFSWSGLLVHLLQKQLCLIRLTSACRPAEAKMLVLD